MRITCPSCQAVYDVPESLLSNAAAQVRCVRCATLWVPDPAPAAAVMAAPPPPNLVRPAPVTRPSAPRPAPARSLC